MNAGQVLIASVVAMLLTLGVSYGAKAQDQVWEGGGTEFDVFANPLGTYGLEVVVESISETLAFNTTTVKHELGGVVVIECFVTFDASGIELYDCTNGTGSGITLGSLTQISLFRNDNGSTMLSVLVSDDGGERKRTIRSMSIDGVPVRYFRENLLRIQ